MGKCIRFWDDDKDCLIVSPKKIMATTIAIIIVVIACIWCVGIYFLPKTTLILTFVAVVAFIAKRFDLISMFEKKNLIEAGVKLEQD